VSGFEAHHGTIGVGILEFAAGFVFGIEAGFSSEHDGSTGVLISPLPGLLPDVVGWNRWCRWKLIYCSDKLIYACCRLS